MDAPCKVQGSIHVFRLNHKSMCPGFWVHIRKHPGDFESGEKRTVSGFKPEDRPFFYFIRLCISDLSPMRTRMMPPEIIAGFLYFVPKIPPI